MQIIVLRTKIIWLKAIFCSQHFRIFSVQRGIRGLKRNKDLLFWGFFLY